MWVDNVAVVASKGEKKRLNAGLHEDCSGWNIDNMTSTANNNHGGEERRREENCTK